MIVQLTITSYAKAVRGRCLQPLVAFSASVESIDHPKGNRNLTILRKPSDVTAGRTIELTNNFKIVQLCFYGDMSILHKLL